MELQKKQEDDRFPDKVIFSDEAAFHICSRVSCHKVRICGMENLHATVEQVRESPKVNVFYAVSALEV